MLHRLASCINCTLDFKLTAYIGGDAEDLELVVFTDADLAGCKLSKRSTSGVLLALSGPRSFFPLTAIPKKQTAVSHSSTESELCWRFGSSHRSCTSIKTMGKDFGQVCCSTLERR